MNEGYSYEEEESHCPSVAKNAINAENGHRIASVPSIATPYYSLNSLSQPSYWLTGPTKRGHRRKDRQSKPETR